MNVSWETSEGRWPPRGDGDEWSLAITTTLILLSLAGVTAIDSSCQARNFVIPTLLDCEIPRWIITGNLVTHEASALSCAGEMSAWGSD